MAAILHIRSKTYEIEHLERRVRFRDKYLDIVHDALGDWIVYYQPQPRAHKPVFHPVGYFAAACILSIGATDSPGYSEAGLGQFIDFPAPVPFSTRYPLFYFESRMLESDGSVNASLAQQEVRTISDEDCMRIIKAGMGSAWIEADPPEGPAYPFGFAEDPPPAIERTQILTARPLRDRAFRHLVGKAYGWKCAMTGISMHAPDTSHEIECAHIRPVDQSGPDSVSNGLALCRSAHWLFDKGLLSIDADYRILKSRHCRGSAIERFLNATGRINVPDNPRCRPHPDFLLYHRECIFLR